jgi:guanylate kinase
MNKLINIYGKTRANAYNKMDEILSTINKSVITRCIKTCNEYTARLLDGTFYRTLIGTDSARGYKYHYAYIDKWIDGATIQNVIAPNLLLPGKFRDDLIVYYESDFSHNRNKYIICIVGDSGSGKTTLCERLKKESYLRVVDSLTTRPPRSPDEIGHEFVNDDQYKIMMELGVICAHTDYNGYMYGATKSQVEYNDLYVIDYPGLKYFYEVYSGSKKIHTVYISTPEKERRQRMAERGDSQEAIAERIEYDKEVFNNVKSYCDKTIENINFNTASMELHNFVQNVWAGKFDRLDKL